MDELKDEFTVYWQAIWRIINNGLWAAWQVIFTIDLGLTSALSVGAGPEIDVVFFWIIPIGHCKYWLSVTWSPCHERAKCPRKSEKVWKPLTTLGAVIFIAKVLAKFRHVDDATLRKFRVVCSGCEWDWIIISSSACLTLQHWDQRKAWISIAELGLPPAIGSPFESLPLPQSNALAGPGGLLSGHP